MIIEDLWLIGIGTGSPSHMTLEGVEAIRCASVILLPRKGAAKDNLADIRLRIIEAAGSEAKIVSFEYPERDEALPYQERVRAWHDEIAMRWRDALAPIDEDGAVALLVWGDPSLYDSTIRIARRLYPEPRIRVVPGITALQALTAAHRIPLNTINGPVLLTTGRRLREGGWPDRADSVVVMLDGECSFQELEVADLLIWWGANLGSDDEAILAGRVRDVGEEIVKTRAKLRARQGWVMDTYLLRRSPSD